ncbi:hypothetical protein KUTeg_018031 [Tegillarca granosa]|uniref:DZIP3-like HEPN domain-containing protein n=1 Tax=Tegillarca granosa TaxID=220873 RepID=A0ABQ9EGN3_TEGGR|nr:hypothetical protein KUTeg_018031 [Tegillarca granosa]
MLPGTMEENSEYRNFIRLSVLLLDFGKDVLCRLLRFKFEAIDELRRLLDDNKRNLSKELSYSQRGILYPRDGITDTVYEKLDFSLTCVLIKTFLETSKSHDGKVLKYINVLTHQKDRLFCNPVCITVDEKKFKNMWDTLQQALIDIGTECFTEKSLEKKINEIYDMTITDFDKECHKTYKLQKVSDASTLPTKKSYIWTEGRARFVEISGWLDVAVIMMRSVLTKKISQKELAEKILQKPFVLKDLKPYQKKKLLKMAQDNEEKKQKENWYQDLDFTSLFFSLRHWGYIPKHTSGWGKPPNKIDFSLAADMERIRLVRRKVLNHKNGTDMEQVDYVEHKNELSSSIKRINDQLKDKHVEKTMKQLFKKWVISEYMQLKHSHQEPSEKEKC